MVPATDGSKAKSCTKRPRRLPRASPATLVEDSLIALGLVPPFPRLEFRKNECGIDFLQAAAKSSDVNALAVQDLAKQLGGPLSLTNRLPHSVGLHDPDAVYFVIGRCPDQGWMNAVSSRVGSKLKGQTPWLDALRTFCRQIPSGSGLLVAHGQFTFPFLHRYAEVTELVMGELEQTTPQDLAQALSKIALCRARGTRYGPIRVFRIAADESAFIQPDILCASHCREVRVLHVRRGGNIEKLLDTRLSEQPISSASRTYLFRPASRKPTPFVKSLLFRGALEWHIQSSHPTPAARPGTTRSKCGMSACIIPLKEFNDQDYVAHFTRGPRRAWLEETESDYLDTLLFGTDRDRSSLSSLWRILEQQTLVANNQLTRDATRVVCFTGIPLREFRRRRTFRSHLARWDFEPHGIAIRRDAFVRAGGREVIYGDDSTWTTLKKRERPFFQLAQGRRTDWTQENEWRIVGDLSLRALSATDAVAFVRNRKEADFLDPVCRWPIVVMND